MKRTKSPPAQKRTVLQFRYRIGLLFLFLLLYLSDLQNMPAFQRSATVFSAAAPPQSAILSADASDRGPTSTYERFTRALFIPVAFSLIVALGFIVRLTREKQALQSKATRQFLLNPHFIANSLNAIENLIQTGRQGEAVQYFSHFSHLSRRFFHTAYGAPIRLSEDLKTLKHFLALTQLRFRDIEYDIHLQEGLRPELIQTPAMLLQSYVEEAIWRRLRPIKRPGYLLISIAKAGNELVLQIKDNGLSLEEARKARSGQMDIPQERLQKIGEIAGAKVEEENRLNAAKETVGVQVRIRLPLKYGA